MLVNALTPEELRIAILDGNSLENFQIEVAERGLTRGNIYRGVVTSIQPSLNAAFIDYGAGKNGFLPFHDVVESQYHRKKDGPHRIEMVLDKGRPLLVQVVREAEGQKGAAVTTNLSLAGRYLVFTPWDEMRGVSRKLEDEDARRKLKDQIASLKVPQGAGLIARTNALGQTKVDLRRDLTAILRTWKKIEAEGQRGSGPRLLHSEQDIILRVMRDYVDADLDEIVLDDRSAWEEARDYAATFMPRSRTSITLWEERTPLFAKHDLEQKIDQIHARMVPLKSGGSIVIDHTEALVAIDVNSGRNTRGSNQEETAFSTNLEAAREVARQLRLRDIGGLIVVDFIDMRSRKHGNDLVRTLREEMKRDKARSTVGSISSNGLLEINRQRIQQALHLRTSRPCPTCDGSGRIASPEMIGLNLLRRIEARAVTGTLAAARISLHPELADAIQNGRRAQLAALEQEFGISIEIIASNRLHRPEQEIDWTERPRSEVPAPAPEVAAAPSEPADAAPAGRKKRRKRRKKGNGSGEQVTPAETHAEEDDTAEAASAVEQETSAPHSAEEPRRKKRRRRRGKHRDLDTTPQMDVTGGDTPDQPLPSAWLWEQQEAPAQAATPRETLSDDHPEETVAPAVAAAPARKRRRRSRGRAASAETLDTQDRPSSEERAAAESRPAAAPESTLPETEPAGAPAKKAAARPRRRRKAAGTATEVKPQPAASPDDSGEAAPKAAKPRSRRRAPRKKAAADNSQEPDGGE